MNESTSTQMQADGSICLPSGRPMSSQIPKSDIDSGADRRQEYGNRAIVLYLLENSVEFRELSDLRKKVSNCRPNYYTLC